MLSNRWFWLKLAAQLLCAAPLACLLYDVWRGELGPDPVAAITHRSGIWTLRLLIATLAITPVRRLSGLTSLIRFRRLLGLWSFAYATSHFATYLVIDLGGFWTQIVGDVIKHPFVTAGFVAWLLMLPLALTSTRAMMRRLGRHWLQLHRLVYVSAIAAGLHFVWLVKSGQKIARQEPLIYLIIILLLLALRLPWRRWTVATGAALRTSASDRRV